MKNLFYAFIKSIATAIDEKSPYTGGHINRVVDLTMMIAEKIRMELEAPYEVARERTRQIRTLDPAIFTDISPLTVPDVGIRLPADQQE